ncbi:MAG: autotransporter domain-containing protein, partial [Opitutaceae bacterium]|nr:autotransporter domain-containing protein [Opitutaceae bacterium]
MGIVTGGTGGAYFSNGVIETSGDSSDGIYFAYDGSASLTNVDIITTGSNSHGINFEYMGGVHDLVMDGGSVRSDNGNAINLDVGTNNIVIQNGATFTGAIVSGGTAVNTISLDNSAITGDVTANDDSTINVTLSGAGGSFTGDITRNDNATVTINLDTGATGAGGFNGGNLNVGENSAWTFDKDSHGNHGENHGVWNIGDHQVTFDNLHHTGTLNLAADTGTGPGSGGHGSLTVTGTASGDGIVHLDTTGDGTRDPNEVLPGIVTGDGTENWHWDPVDWGLEELIVTPNPDGTLTITQNGVSAAGAMLNSAVVLQQAMWFAQNDSLAKRLGDLRLAALADLSDQTARPDRTDRTAQPDRPEQPRNTAALWTRAYAQRLNLDAEVAGRRFTQQLYGIDLGADHPWPLAAGTATLHTGLYLGYARSDADYKASAAEAELTSTHGGVYATYQRKSGLYIDAILKSAAIENTLRAPVAAASPDAPAATTLEAGYNNLNLGLSIEAGKKYPLQGDWQIEPQLQLSYLRILAKDYTAATPDAATTLRIAASDMDALQFRLTQT